MNPGSGATIFSENLGKTSISHLRYPAFWKMMKKVVVVIKYSSVTVESDGKEVVRPACCGGIVINENGRVLTCVPEFFCVNIIRDLKIKYEGDASFSDARIAHVDNRSMTIIELGLQLDEATVLVQEERRHPYAMFASRNDIHVCAPVIGIAHPSGLTHSLLLGEISYPCGRDPLESEQMRHPPEGQDEADNKKYNQTPPSRTLRDCVTRDWLANAGFSGFLEDFPYETLVIQTSNTNLSVGAEGCPIFNPSGLVMGIFVVAKNGFDYFFHAEDLKDYVEKYQQRLENGATQSREVNEVVTTKSEGQLKKKTEVAREHEISVSEERSLQKNIKERTDKFEKLVTNSPNSSFVWIKYMEFVLSLKDIVKARSIAERALETINTREGGEMLNIWIAYIKLENEYGSPPEEAVSKTFEKALQHCDPKKLHLALLGIYEETGQFRLADRLMEKMIKKFRKSCKVWLRSVQNLLKQGKDGFETVRTRAFLHLPQRKHIKFFSQTAILEFKCGVPDRGRTVFESLLQEYPKRTDVWSVYLDEEIHHGDRDRVRALFHRASCSSLQHKKTRLLKKYQNFEKSLNDEERIELT